MKFSKKIIALFAVASMMVSSAITASADFSSIVVADKVVAEVGETITLDAEFDSLVNAKGMELHFYFDSDAFTVDTADNEDYNFGSKKNPVYYPMWMSDDFLANFNEEMSFISYKGVFSYSANEGALNFVMYNDGGYVFEEADFDEDEGYPHKTIGVNLTTAKEGIYTIEVKAIVSDDTVGDINSTKTIKVLVGDVTEDDEEDDNTPVNMVEGVDEIAYGRHEGKSSIATPTAVAFDGLAKIVVSNSKVAETQTWEAPTTLGEGKSSVLAIITYDKAEWAGSTFTVNFLNAAEAVIKAFTYTVQ